MREAGDGDTEEVTVMEDVTEPAIAEDEEADGVGDEVRLGDGLGDEVRRGDRVGVGDGETRSHGT